MADQKIRMKIQTVHISGQVRLRLDLFFHIRPDGIRRGNVFGTYLHGLFDTGLLTEALASWLCRRKGTAPESAAPMDYESFRESQLDLLAETVRESLDMQAIYRAVARY